MERFQKQYDFNKPSDMVEAHDTFNGIVAWLNENVSSTNEYDSGDVQVQITPTEVSKAAKLLTKYLQARGERTELMGAARFVIYGIGDGWKVCYMSSMNHKQAEVAVCLDDATLAVQVKLMFS